MRTENQKMKQYLKENGIDAEPIYIYKGWLKGVWRFHKLGTDWWGNFELEEKLTALGFKDIDGNHLRQSCANGYTFSAFVTFDRTQEFLS